MNFKSILIAFTSLIALKANAHGNISFPSCWFGGDYFKNSAYTCKISFQDARPEDDSSLVSSLKKFDVADILASKQSLWKTEDGFLSKYLTAEGIEISLMASVSCPIEGQNVIDPNVIDLRLSFSKKGSESKSTDLTDISISKGRTLRQSFFVDGLSGDVSCKPKQ